MKKEKMVSQDKKASHGGMPQQGWEYKVDGNMAAGGEYAKDAYERATDSAQGLAENLKKNHAKR